MRTTALKLWESLMKVNVFINHVFSKPWQLPVLFYSRLIDRNATSHEQSFQLPIPNPFIDLFRFSLRDVCTDGHRLARLGSRC